MDIMKRIKILLESDFSTQQDYDDLCAIVAVFENGYSIPITEENAGIMITHMAAAFRRNRTGEAINPVDKVVMEELEASEAYQTGQAVTNSIIEAIQNPVNEVEKEYFLLHICNLLEEVDA